MPSTTTVAPTSKAPLVTLDEEARQAVRDLVTKTDDPVDNIFSEWQQNLLKDTLRNSWTPTGPEGRRKFMVCANVGIFEHTKTPPLVPDVMVSLDAAPPEDEDINRAYYLWELGPPDVVVEIVSNKKGDELGGKLGKYAGWGIPYYVVTDPFRQLSRDLVRVFVLDGGRYQRTSDWFLHGVGLGLTLWNGTYDEMEATFVRWCDEHGVMLGTGLENTAAETARRRAEADLRREEAARADAQAARADSEAARAEAALWERDRAIAKLRELGIDI